MTYDMKLCEVRDETREEAWQEASHERAVDTARNLLALGVLSVEQIAQVTGLSIEDVQSLL